MDFVKQLMTNKHEQWLHDRFIRYGKGEFSGPIVDASASKKGLKINATIEYSNTLCEIIGLNSSEVNVNGTIITRKDSRDFLDGILSVTKYSEKKGVYSGEVSGLLSGEALVGLCRNTPGAYLLLDVKSGKNKLSCKKKLPKPGSEADDKFCSAVLDNACKKAVMEDILFDVNEGFKNCRIEHKYVITELTPPEGVKDPSEIRVKAERKGTVVRKVTTDDTVKETTVEIIA